MIRILLIALCLTALTNPTVAANRGYFGAWFGDLPDSETVVQSGVIVKKVYAGMAAEKAGLKEGEIVTRINGKIAYDPPTAVELLAESAAGEKASLTVIDRTGGFHAFDIVAIMGDRPTAEFAKLKKTWARCSTKATFCDASVQRPAQRNPGHDTNMFPGWLIIVLVALLVCGLLIKEKWRNKASVG